MKNHLLRGLSAAALLAAPFATARADLVLSSFTPLGGTGIGTVNTILTVQSQGNNTVEAGCVSFGGTIGSTMTGGVCGGSTADVKTGASQTQTRTFGQVGITDASQFGIVLNSAEPAGNGITVNTLQASFYSANGTLIHVASLQAPVTFLNTSTGTGNSGYLFVLTPAEATIINNSTTLANRGGIVVGLQSNLGCAGTETNTCQAATGGNETFFVANVGAPSTVPEPATVALMATGLVGLGGFARRRRTQA